MAVDPRKQQRKLERRKAKERSRNKAVVRQAHGLANRFERAAAGRILDCLVTSVMWDEGLGNVVFSRKLADGQVAHATFLLDVFCIGVKDVALGVSSPQRYSELIFGKLFARHAFERRAPEFIRKLIEGSVGYFRAMGIEPHADYGEASAICGDVDAAACPDDFQFGREGKPFFVSGPLDSPQRCARIINMLTTHCGRGEFDYLLHLSQSDLIAAGLSRQFLPE